MVGVFGILAYSIQQRVRDIGVRRALGATTGDVFRLVVGSTVRIIAVGAVIGLVTAAGLGRLVVDHALRGRAAGSGDLRAGDARPCHDRRDRHRRPGVARDENRPGRGAQRADQLPFPVHRTAPVAPSAPDAPIAPDC